VRVLLAEDHARVADGIATGLRRHGAAVDVAPDGAEALFLARVHPYDVLVLDRDLPEVHGDDVCRRLNAERPELKILMLTAAAATEDLVAGLALGVQPAADVVSTEELLASVWDANVDPFTNIVRMTVMKLRRKLGAPDPIVTVPGVGYRL
jgi:DNA-binding response OmpR family regulator